MPKVKRTKKVPKKSDEPKFPKYKFDIKSILKEREAAESLWYQLEKKSTEQELEGKTTDEKVEDIVMLPRINDNLEIIDLDQDASTSSLTLLRYATLDFVEYKKTLEINYNSSEADLCLKRFLLMSIEENVFVTNIHFNHLMRANWSPTLDDIKKCLLNWSADLENLTKNKPLVKHEVDKCKQIRQYNFELVMNLISYYVPKTDNKFSKNDLLTLGKLCVALFFDHQCRKAINVLQLIFSCCIENALDEHDEAPIISFCNELFSVYTNFEVAKIIVNVILPIRNSTTKKLYTFISFKLYKIFLGITNNINTFPSNFSDWFMHGMVDKNYFSNKPVKTLETVIKLLEHVAIVINLYQNENEVRSMYQFYNSFTKALPFLRSHSIFLNDIVDQWRRRLDILRFSRIKFDDMENGLLMYV